MKYERKDVLVGIFVIVAFVVVVIIVAFKQGSRIGRYHLTAEFKSITGITAGTKVKLKGYDIGEVKKITFNPKPGLNGAYLQMVLYIGNEYPLFRGTKAQIKSVTPLSGYFVNLDISKVSAVRLKPGDKIPGEDAYDMSQSLVKVDDILTKVVTVMGKVTQIEEMVINTKADKKTEHIVSQITELLKSTEVLLANLDRTVDTGRISVMTLTKSLDGTLKTANTTVSKVDTMLTKVDSETLTSLNQNLERLSFLLSDLDLMLVDNRDNMKTIMENIRAISVSLKDLSKHPGKIITGGVE